MPPSTSSGFLASPLQSHNISTTSISTEPVRLGHHLVDHRCRLSVSADGPRTPTDCPAASCGPDRRPSHTLARDERRFGAAILMSPRNPASRVRSENLCLVASALPDTASPSQHVIHLAGRITGGPAGIAALACEAPPRHIHRRRVHRRAGEHHSDSRGVACALLCLYSPHPSEISLNRQRASSQTLSRRFGAASGGGRAAIALSSIPTR
jgi:hypothetical protein